MKRYKLSELQDNLSVELDITIQGNPNCEIEGVCTIQDSKPNHITFLVNPLYKKYLTSTRAAAVILAECDAKDCPVNAVISSNPYYAYAKIAGYFNNRPRRGSGIHPSASIGKNCAIALDVSIGAHCVIGDNVTIGTGTEIGPGCVIGENSEIGNNCRLDANVTLYHFIKVGNYVSISSGVVIGSDGFGIAKYQNHWHKVPQLGRVIIEDYVEIGANCAIDRGAIEDTIIGKGAKLDNLIQVGHNVKIGENTAIAGCVGISGSAEIGKNCIIGGAACFAGHIQVCDNVVITGMTAVTKSIREPGIYSSGAGGLMKNTEWRKNTIRVRQLEELIERVKNLEAALERVES